MRTNWYGLFLAVALGITMWNAGARWGECRALAFSPSYCRTDLVNSIIGMR